VQALVGVGEGKCPSTRAGKQKGKAIQGPLSRAEGLQA